jgi:diguanylate cyclase (GGDEF)-like protein
VDGLTGLADRRELSTWLAEHADTGKASLALLDVDNLAHLNERHGEHWVNELLAGLGSLLRNRCGRHDVPARVGGDEFALGLLEEDLTLVLEEVEHVRRGFHAFADGAMLSVAVCEPATLKQASRNPSLLDAVADDALEEARPRAPKGLAVFRPPY